MMYVVYIIKQSRDVNEPSLLFLIFQIKSLLLTPNYNIFVLCIINI